jgi:ABC-2 type transport system permease protein
MLASVFAKTTRDRWKGMAIAMFSLGLLLWMVMAVYQDIDITIYTDLPEVFLSIMGIPDGADVASLAVGVLYGLYGALTLAGLAVSMGSASVAGEERDGTIGLLLGNPKSRTNVLVSKAASMVLLVGLGSLALWGAAPLVAGILDVRMGGMQIGAYALHLFVNALFYGFLAMAIGAWTGKRGLASGVSAGVMALGFVAVGIFPIIEGWENVAKVFPWHYFDNAQPVINGIQWGDLAVLFGATVLLAVIALVGVNRRDLRGQNVGVTLLDRLRANPMTQKVVDRLAGATRVSRIWIKTASEHQGLLIIIGYLMFFVMGVLMGPLYGLMDETLLRFTDQIPKELWAFVGAGGGSMSTAEGFYEAEVFGLMAPIAVMVVTVVIGVRALAGEEQNRTMGLLLANPIKRSRVLLEKVLAMVVYAIAVGFSTFAGVWLGSIIGGLGIAVGNIAATSLLATLVGLVFGALALALSAATGRVRVSIFGTVGAALVFHLVNSFASLNDTLAGWARVSPFSYYLNTHPLENGMDWGNGAILAGLTIVLVAVSVVLFQRRDLRQTG